MSIPGALIALTLGANFALARQCQEITVPVTISAEIATYNLDIPSNNVEVTDFFVRANQQGGDFGSEILTGVRTPTRLSYRVRTKTCTLANHSERYLSTCHDLLCP